MSVARGWVDSLALAGSALAVLVAGCQTSRSAEREDSFAQQGETRREEGPWTRETWEWRDGPTSVVAPPAAGSFGGAPQHAAVKYLESGPDGNATGSAPAVQELVRHVIESHAPVISTTQTQTTAAGEAKEARSARFGWSPWTIAIGALVALAGLYGLWRVKGKLGV